VLFEDAPLLTLFRLGALFVVSPLDGIAHGTHDGLLDYESAEEGKYVELQW